MRLRKYAFRLPCAESESVSEVGVSIIPSVSALTADNTDVKWYSVAVAEVDIKILTTYSPRAADVQVQLLAVTLHVSGRWL